MDKKILINFENHEEKYSIPLDSYCKSLAKRNQVILHKLEQYLNTDLKLDDKLCEIRSLVLSVSGDLSRLSENITIEEFSSERL